MSRAFEILLTAVRIPHIPKQYIQNEVGQGRHVFPSSGRGCQCVLVIIAGVYACSTGQVKPHALVKSSPASLEYVNHGLSARSQWSSSSSHFFDLSRYVRQGLASLSLSFAGEVVSFLFFFFFGHE